MTGNALPIAQTFDLGRLSRSGDRVVIAPSRDDLARIARWADVAAIESFTANIELRKLSPSRFAFDAELRAEIVQSCVVTLDPLHTKVERAFARELHLSPAAHRATSKFVDIEVTVLDEDGAEEIASLRYDLAVPVLEELALAIDPYPRAPGAAFEAPKEGTESPVHPFAALKKLKTTP